MVFQRIKKEAQFLYEQFYDILEKTDFSIPTFLAFGGVLQLLSFAYLPSRISALLPLLWLGWRLTKSAFDSRNVFETSFTDVQRGKHITSLPDTADGVVVFVLGARLNHPFGKLSPGTAMLDIPFKAMWSEAEESRHKWGYLGKTATLADTSDNAGTTTVWISYWRDLEGLHAFARSAVHRLGQDGWEEGKYPCVGIMHETYHVPKGHHEAIYANFPRWGLAATKSLVNDGEGQTKAADILVPNRNGSTMYSRMGRGVRFILKENRQ